MISIDHSSIVFNYSAKKNKSFFPPIKFKLYHKAISDSISTSLSNQSAILYDQISNSIYVDNLDPINISNNIAANILTNTIMDIHNHLPDKTSNQTLEFNSIFNRL